MTPHDAYVAGFFDGEGSVLIYKRTKSRSPKSSTIPYQIRAAITNTNCEVLEFIRAHYGGNIMAYAAVENRRQGWKWTALCQDASRFFVAIRPFLIVKGREVDLALEMQARINDFKRRNHAPGRRGALPLPPDEIAARDELWERLKQIRAPIAGLVANPSSR